MGLAERIPTRHRGTAAFGLVLCGSLGIQTSAALVSAIFDTYSPAAVSALRILVATFVLWALVRPNPFALRRADLPQVLVYGLVLTAMNICFYNAVALIPLGVTVTFEYLGAFVIALLGVRRLRDGFFALAALAGVVLVAVPTLAGDYNPAGFLWALGAAGSMAGYTIFSARMGTSSPATAGLRGTTLSMAVSAIIQLPLSVPLIPTLDADAWWRIILAATLGLALAYSADNIAGQLTSAAVIGVLFSIDPVMGAIIGTVLLDEVLHPASYAGIVLVAASGAYIVWRTNRSAIQISTRTAALPTVPGSQQEPPR